MSASKAKVVYTSHKNGIGLCNVLYHLYDTCWMQRLWSIHSFKAKLIYTSHSRHWCCRQRSQPQKHQRKKLLVSKILQSIVPMINMPTHCTKTMLFCTMFYNMMNKKNVRKITTEKLPSIKYVKKNSSIHNSKLSLSANRINNNVV